MGPTGQLYETMPQELTQLIQLEMQKQELKKQQVQPQPQVQQQPQAPKARFGDWAIHEDAQGEFYIHEPTGQLHEVMPPELNQLLRVELQKQDLKTQLTQKCNSHSRC